MDNILRVLSTAFVLLILGSCAKESGTNDGPGSGEGDDKGTQYPQIEASFKMPLFDNEDRILDFSRVGYRWSDEQIPLVAVVKTISAPADGADATTLIQNAIYEVGGMPLKGKHRGAILLKAGTYNVNGRLLIGKSGIVLRGEGSDALTGTKIVGRGVRTLDPESATLTDHLITIGGSGTRTESRPAAPNIIDDYIAQGQFWVRVNNANAFGVGNQVVVYRPATDQWIADLKLTGIWQPRDVERMAAERVVTKIKGDTLWFENPIACPIEKRYGGGYVYPYSYNNRIEECGIESMAIESEFFGEQNETHCWSGIVFSIAQHSWVKDVKGRYFGFGLVNIQQYSKNITVQDCFCGDFQSIITGNRRYPFIISGQLSLVKDCSSDLARHPYATSGSNAVGPNVFLRGTATNMWADAGPHRHWSQGTLYDNLTCYGEMNIRNRYTNTNHGWAATGDVNWNCTTAAPPSNINHGAWGFIIESPHVSGHNYLIGGLGQQKTNSLTTPAGPSLPATVISFGTKVAPLSLFEAQLALRRQFQPNGVFDVK